MKEIVAIIRQNKINATKKALNAVGITSFTATGRVLGRGKGMVDYRVLKGAEEGYQEAISLLGSEPRLVPKRMLTVVVSDDFAEKTINAIIETNQTGNAGDGKIFVLPVTEVTRVRDGKTAEGKSGEHLLDSSAVEV